MKKIYRNLKTAVLALGCMSLLLSSCSDFLDRNPHDFVSPEIFYKNESDCMMHWPEFIGHWLPTMYTVRGTRISYPIPTT